MTSVSHGDRSWQCLARVSMYRRGEGLSERNKRANYDDEG
jgi:hypothetical protein